MLLVYCVVLVFAWGISALETKARDASFTIKSLTTSSGGPKFGVLDDKFVFAFGEQGMTYTVTKPPSDSATFDIPPVLIGELTSLRIYVENGIMYVDMVLTDGIETAVIKKNTLTNYPSHWQVKFNDSSMEVVNKDRLPVFQMTYVTSSRVLVKGIFECTDNQVFFLNEGGVTVPKADVGVALKMLKPIFTYP